MHTRHMPATLIHDLLASHRVTAPLLPCCSMAGAHGPTRPIRSIAIAKCETHCSNDAGAHTSAPAAVYVPLCCPRYSACQVHEQVCRGACQHRAFVWHDNDPRASRKPVSSMHDPGCHPTESSAPPPPARARARALEGMRRGQDGRSAAVSAIWLCTIACFLICLWQTSARSCCAASAARTASSILQCRHEGCAMRMSVLWHARGHASIRLMRRRA